MANPEPDRCQLAGYYVQQQTVDGCRRAAAEYRQCLKTEPRSAKAKSGLANTYLFRLVLGDLSRDEALPRANALLEDASRIDSACADVHLSRSRLLCLGEWQWDRAQEELEHAGKLPIAAAWQGCILVERGQLEEAFTCCNRPPQPAPVPVHFEIISRGSFSGGRLLGMRVRKPKGARTAPALLVALSRIRQVHDCSRRFRPGQAVLPPRHAATMRPKPACWRSSPISMPLPAIICARSVSSSVQSACIRWYPSRRSMRPWEIEIAP